MKQPEFMMFVNNIQSENVIQVTDGTVVAKLSPLLEISHNYKKKDLMIITFTEDKKQYTIPDRRSLEEITRLHLEEKPSMTIREYCEKNLI